jgi:hypothetical protein
VYKKTWSIRNILKKSEDSVSTSFLMYIPSSFLFFLLSPRISLDFLWGNGTTSRKMVMASEVFGLANSFFHSFNTFCSRQVVSYRDTVMNTICSLSTGIDSRRHTAYTYKKCG